MLLRKSQSNDLSKSALQVRGFTLVEMAVVIALIAILAALALPNYQDSVRKGRRAEAQAELLRFAGRAEQIFTEFNDYTGSAAEEPADTNFYTFTVAAGTTTFTITAEPENSQVDDLCGEMSLTQTGERTHTGTTQPDCW